MSKNRTTQRLERRAEREAKRPAGAPRGRRSRTPVKVGSAARGGFNVMPFAIALGVTAIVAVIAFATYQTLGSETEQPAWMRAIMDDDPNLPGQYVPPHPGPDLQLHTNDDRHHFANGVVFPICTAAQLESGQIGECYTTNPPTSGPHAQSPAPFGVLQNPLPRENMVHTMEHGAVIVWWNSTNEAAIEELKSWVQRHVDRRRLVTMVFYPDMESETIALTAWTRLDKFPISQLQRDRVDRFIETHQRRFNPEGF